MNTPWYLLVTLVLVLCTHSTDAQFGFGGFRNLFRPLQNLLQPVMRGVQNIFGGGPNFINDGTRSPQATGKDKLFPDDCGREENSGTGKLCFPDGLLCQERPPRQQGRTNCFLTTVAARKTQEQGSCAFLMDCCARNE